MSDKGQVLKRSYIAESDKITQDITVKLHRDLPLQMPSGVVKSPGPQLLLDCAFALLIKPI